MYYINDVGERRTGFGQRRTFAAFKWGRRAFDRAGPPGEERRTTIRRTGFDRRGRGAGGARGQILTTLDGPGF